MRDSEKRGQVIHWAATYDRLLYLITLGQEARFRRRIIESAELSTGQRVLDVGCGTGTLAIEATKAVGPDGRVDGIDPSPEMIARAKSKARASGQDAYFQEAGIESIPFPDRSFDSVLSSFMFHHLDEPMQRAGLAEVHRVLVPGGRLTIIDFAGDGPFLHRLAGRFSDHGSEGHSNSGTHFEWLSREAAKTGFRNITSVTFKPRFLHRLSADADGSNDSSHEPGRTHPEYVKEIPT